MSRSVLDTLLYLSFAATLLPLIIIVIGFNRQPSSFKWLAVVMGLSFTFDVGARLYYIISGNSPNLISITFGLICIPFLSIFFYNAIGWRSLKKGLIAFNILYFLFGIMNFAFLQKDGINSYTMLLQTLHIISMSLIFFFMLLRELPEQQLHTMPLFWVISGFFFSYSGKLVVFTATHYLVNYIGDNLVIVWSFHVLLTIIANLLIAYGTWLNHKQIFRFTSS